jgi:hypothetical protein
MTFLGSKTLSRLVPPLAASILGAAISLASSLPRAVSTQPAGETTEAAQSTPLPKMMDTSASYVDTGNASPANATERETGASPQSSSASIPAQHARVAPDELSGGPVDQCKPVQPQGHVPEPMSIILMTSGLLGLIGVRRFRKSAARLS